MPDISMCSGEGCPIKDTCYRFTATPTDPWQAYFGGVPYSHEDALCVEHWPDVYAQAKKAQARKVRRLKCLP
jgi:hypothetical protein